MYRGKQVKTLGFLVSYNTAVVFFSFKSVETEFENISPGKIEGVEMSTM